MLRPGVGTDSRYLAYVLRGRPFVDYANAAVYGVRMPRVSWVHVRGFPVRQADLPEQRAIADFLDRECARIADLTQTAERLSRAVIAPALELAKREFDEQPLGRIGYAFQVQLGKMLDESLIDPANTSPYLRNANVHWDHLRLDDLKEMTFSRSERAKFELRVGDLLVCEGGEPGRAAEWNGAISDCYFQKALHRVRPWSDGSTRYLLWALRVLSSRDAFAVDAPGRYTHLTAEMLRAVRVPMPPAHVQRARAAVIDAAADNGRALAEAADALRARLAEYRDALITEAVTGQLDVTAVSDAQMDERAHAAAEGAGEIARDAAGVR